MARRICSNALWSAQSIAGSSALTATATPIFSTDALALYLTAISGTSPDVTFTYSLCPGMDPSVTFVTPQSPVTIGANKAAVDVMDFAPEASGFIKIIATNNGTGTVIFSAYLVSQEGDA